MNLTDISRLHASVDDVLKAGTASEPMTWYIARVEPRGERKALNGLIECGISAYLPCEVRWMRHARKKERLALAMFPGYLFVGITARQSLYDVRSVDGVFGVVGQTVPLPLTQAGIRWLVALRSSELAGDFDRTKPSVREFAKGQKLRITEEGPLKGQVGTMVEMTSDKRVRVMLNAAIGWDHCAANDKVEAVDHGKVIG